MKRIVELCKVTVTVESSPGNGADFFVTLPKTAVNLVLAFVLLAQALNAVLTVSVRRPSRLSPHTSALTKANGFVEF